VNPQAIVFFFFPVLGKAGIFYYFAGAPAGIYAVKAFFADEHDPASYAFRERFH
jgi:DUF971 family protein